MNLMDPLVTVLMTTYNGARYIREAIEDILNQSFADFEFLIIDDASKDATVSIIQTYPDTRLRLVKNNENLGQINSLNKGIGLSRGKYIARIDQDDRCSPERLEQQVGFLEQNPNVGVLSTGYKVIDEDGQIIETPELPFLNSSTLAWRIMWHNCMAPHSGIMLRRDLVTKIGGYNKDFWYAADYNLWLRMSFEADLAKLSENLVEWRTHKAGTTAFYGLEKQVDEVKEILAAGFSHLLGRPVSVEMAWAAREIFGRKTPNTFVPTDKLVALILDIYRAFLIHRTDYNSIDLRSVKADVVRMICSLELSRWSTNGQKDLRSIFKAFQISPWLTIQSGAIQRGYLKDSLAHKLYVTLRKFFSFAIKR